MAAISAPRRKGAREQQSLRTILRQKKNFSGIMPRGRLKMDRWIDGPSKVFIYEYGSTGTPPGLLSRTPGLTEC